MAYNFFNFFLTIRQMALFSTQLLWALAEFAFFRLFDLHRDFHRRYETIKRVNCLSHMRSPRGMNYMHGKSV